MSKIVEKVVPNYPTIYQIHKLNNEGCLIPQETYRVRKRIKIAGKWTVRVKSFQNFEEAKIFSKMPVRTCTVSKPLLTFGTAFEQFLYQKEFIEKRAPGTIQGYKNRAKHFSFFENMLVHEITSTVVDGWINLLFDPRYEALQQASRKDYGHELVLLSTFFRYFKDFKDDSFQSPLLKRHRISLRKTKRQEEIRFLSEEEERDFLYAIQDKTIRDLALFQLNTGCRIGEASALRRCDIDFSKGLVHIRSHLHWDRTKGGKVLVLAGTKTGPDRRIPLTPECMSMLRERCKDLTGLIFGDANGSWLQYRRVQYEYNKALKKIGVSQRSTHTLRHTFAVRFLERTKDIHALQRALGHSTLKTTQEYAKYSDESVRKAFEVFSGVPSDVSKVVSISKDVGIS